MHLAKTKAMQGGIESVDADGGRQDRSVSTGTRSCIEDESTGGDCSQKGADNLAPTCIPPVVVLEPRLLR